MGRFCPCDGLQLQRGEQCHADTILATHRWLILIALVDRPEPVRRPSCIYDVCIGIVNEVVVLHTYYYLVGWMYMLLVYNDNAR